MEYWGKSLSSASRLSAAFSFPWWALGLAGLFALLLVVWMGPGESSSAPTTLSSSARVLENGTEPSAPAADAAAPVRVSVLDVVGKLSLAILVGYGVVFILRRLGAGKKGLCEKPAFYAPGGRELRVQDSLTLPGEEGTLYLVEVQGHTLLIGAAAEPLYLLWTSAAEQTSALPPVSATSAAAPNSSGAAAFSGPRAAAEDKRPLGNVMLRAERDWAQQRRRLINALMESESR